MKEMEQILHSLKETLKDDQEWMDKYNSLEAIPEDGDEKVTEGRIEVLEGVIKQIEEAMKPSQEESVRNIKNFLKGEHENV